MRPRYRQYTHLWLNELRIIDPCLGIASKASAYGRSSWYVSLSTYDSKYKSRENYDVRSLVPNGISPNDLFLGLTVM